MISTPLTTEAIRKKIRGASPEELTELLGLENCPKDIILKYAFPKITVRDYSPTDYNDRQEAGRIAARGNKLISTENITEYLSREILESAGVEGGVLRWTTGLMTLDEFFDNPNFSSDVFIEVLKNKDISKLDGETIGEGSSLPKYLFLSCFA